MSIAMGAPMPPAPISRSTELRATSGNAAGIVAVPHRVTVRGSQTFGTPGTARGLVVSRSCCDGRDGGE